MCNSPRPKLLCACTNRTFRSARCGTRRRPYLGLFFWLTCCSRRCAVRPVSAMSRGGCLNLKSFPTSLWSMWFCPHATEWRSGKRCISQPTEHQRILLQRLGMRLPRRSRNCGSSVRCQWRSVQTETGLLQFWCIGTDNSAAFADRQDLIGLYLGETLDFLCRGPFHFNDFCLQSLSQAKVQPQVGLRHDAPAAMHFVDLRMGAGEDAHTRADRGAVRLRPDELDLDPVLGVAAVIAQKRRQIIHIQNQGIHVAIVVVVAKSGAAA